MSELSFTSRKVSTIFVQVQSDVDQRSISRFARSVADEVRFAIWHSGVNSLVDGHSSPAHSMMLASRSTVKRKHTWSTDASRCGYEFPGKPCQKESELKCDKISEIRLKIRGVMIRGRNEEAFRHEEPSYPSYFNNTQQSTQLQISLRQA